MLFSSLCRDLSATGTGPYRLEFTGLPTGYEPSAHSTDSVNDGTATNAGTSVQFVPNGSTSNVNVAINIPADFLGNTNPYLYVPLWWNGADGNISGAGSATPGTPSVFATVSNVGTIASNATRGVNTSATTPNSDAGVFDQVGKVGLGDVDISDDDSTLWVVNLNTKALVKIPIATPANQSSYTIPDP